jgi:hypothetical protein
MRIYILIILLISHFTYAQSISTTGGWSATRSSADIANIGQDLPNSLSGGASNQTLMSLNSLTTGNWQVQVQRLDAVWDSSLILELYKQSNGSAVPGSISPIFTGGDSYMTINTMPQTIFNLSVSGSGSINDIQIRYRMSGISVLLPAKQYSTTIMYTLVDL